MSSNKQREANKAKITGTEIEPVVDTAEVATIPVKMGVEGFKLKKLITVPSLVIKVPGQEFVLRFDSAITVSKVVDPKKPTEKPADVANVTDMQTGAQYVFLLPSVVKGNLELEYDAATDTAPPGYVGKVFLIRNLGKTDGKRYSNFGIAELEAE